MKRTGLIALAAILAAAPSLAQEVERVSGQSVAIYNIAGHVEIVPGSGSEVVVRIARHGDDADRLSIETGEIRGRETVRIVYPADQVVYPEMGRRSNTTQRVDDDGTFSDRGRGGGDQIRVRGSGRGLEAWADLVIEVPSGQEIHVYLAVGTVEARNVDGELDIDTGSGAVTAEDMSGSLSIDTGSGAVEVTGMDGDLTVDTGSGSIRASDVVAGEVELDTGSGRVVGSGIEARSLSVDTGSGGVDLERIRSADVMVDTGSGSVELELLTDVESLHVDTGSGSVTVWAPSDLGASLEIDTGSGGIDIDFPVEVRSARRDSMCGQLGDGRGDIVIDTGSGSIRLLRGGIVLR